MSYLELVTECEHGWGEEHGVWCPGGSRVRFTPNYEAAAKEFLRQRDKGLAADSRPDLIVDAALEVTE